MKNSLLYFSLFLFIISSAVVLTGFKEEHSKEKPSIHFPYKQAGLTEPEAAAHLLSRFSFGATPGQVDELVKTGLENWFANQLEGQLPNTELNEQMKQYPLLALSTEELIKNCPDAGRVVKMAMDDGVISKDALGKDSEEDRKRYRAEMDAYIQKKGLISRRELFRQQLSQKIMRALKSNNQLQEVMTGFWFNHFNVSVTKNETARFIPNYEREVIRPNVLGKFETLLLATAKSPAMLTYLDNAKSSLSMNNATAVQKKQQQVALEAMEQQEMMADSEQKAAFIAKAKAARKEQGLNENYAREIMELHTMGVDAGYTQADVTEAARVLTGWTVYPMEGYGNQAAQKLIDRFGKSRLEQMGFVQDGPFLFNANRHDKGEKTVLATNFPAGGGYEEGVKLIDLLAHHPKTAQFICRKLAVHFVNDNPPQSLVDKMAKTFSSSDGDIKKVLITMATSPEFWAKDAIRQKTKSPFELAMSAMRILDAEVKMPFQVYTWVSKMGENMYYYQAPTGFPDKGQYWINTGSLLYRMNFGLALASQRIPGISFNLAGLNNNKEPESAEAALAVYASLLMPGRDMTEAMDRLRPLLNDPELVKKVNEALGKTAPAYPANTMEPDENEDMMMANSGKERTAKDNPGKKRPVKNDMNMNQTMIGKGNNSVLAQVVGVLIGSPEFQRR